MRHSFVGTEHILLGLLAVPEGTAAQVLATFGVRYPDVRTAVVGMMGVGVDAPNAELSFTGRAEDMIGRARREASMRDEAQVGTQHLLLALVHEPGGAAARILLQLDADPAAVRAAIDRA
jgi:ATP-dependent Clp protease ATP-binding subunit ClpA